MANTYASVPASGNQDINGLLAGLRWANTDMTFSFPTDPDQYEYRGERDLNFQSFSERQKEVVREMLSSVASVADLSFTEVDGGAGDLRFAMSDMPPNAWAYYPGNGPDAGDTWYNTVGFDDPVVGTYAFSAMLHEIGHALGFKHGNEPGVFGAMTYEHDSSEYTIMAKSYVGSDGGYAENELNGFPQSLMMYDIAALQYMYGANYDVNAGDNRYQWSPDTGQLSIDGNGFSIPLENRLFMTIWDGGGNDTYDFSNYGTNLSIDLSPGKWTVTSVSQLAQLGVGHPAAGNIANALLYDDNTASLIENAIGGSGNDTIVGNSVDNALAGGLGNDTLTGGAGNDRLDGGLGADTMAGGLGNDTFLVDSIDDSVIESTREGTDTVLAAISYALSANVENLKLTGMGTIDATGNTLDNVLMGNAATNTLSGGAGDDWLYGGTGDDTLDGGTGDDLMIGGMGDDTYIVGARGDLVVEMTSQGIDTVRSSISYTLGTSLDALTLTGTADLTGTGNALGNTLIGNGADNVLDGDSGKDVLIGGGGTDTFVFRPGETNGDKVMDFNDAGASAGDRLAFSGFGPGATLSQTMGTDVYTITADTDLWGELSETFQIAGVTNLDLIGSLKHDVLLVA